MRKPTPEQQAVLENKARINGVRLDWINGVRLD